MFVSLYLSCVGSPDHLACWRKGQFKNKVIEKGLWVKNAVICQDLMVEIDEILASVNFFQFFSSSTPDVTLSPEFERILHNFSL